MSRTSSNKIRNSKLNIWLYMLHCNRKGVEGMDAFGCFWVYDDFNGSILAWIIQIAASAIRTYQPCMQVRSIFWWTLDIIYMQHKAEFHAKRRETEVVLEFPMAEPPEPPEPQQPASPSPTSRSARDSDGATNPLDALDARSDRFFQRNFRFSNFQIDLRSSRKKTMNWFS